MKTLYNKILMPMLSLNVYPGVFNVIGRLAGCTPASVGAKVRNMADTRSNLNELLKGKQLYSTLYTAYSEVLYDLTAVLKESATKGETAKTTNNFCTFVH
jgi:hypothetical protein